MITVTIKYVGTLVPEDIREAMPIAPIFIPDNSYVDSSIYVNGSEGEEIGGSSAKAVINPSIYATNVEDKFGIGRGVIPNATSSTRVVWFDRAIKSAMESTEEDEGVSFDIEDTNTTENLYWQQMKDYMAPYGFEVDIKKA